MIYFILFVGGFILGYLLHYFIELRKIVHGIINIDHTNGLCKFQVNNDLLLNEKNKTCLFIINHKAIINEENTDYDERRKYDI
jgi:hypothetical protein